MIREKGMQSGGKSEVAIIASEVFGYESF